MIYLLQFYAYAKIFEYLFYIFLNILNLYQLSLCFAYSFPLVFCRSIDSQNHYVGPKTMSTVCWIVMTWRRDPHNILPVLRDMTLWTYLSIFHTTPKTPTLAPFTRTWHLKDIWASWDARAQSACACCTFWIKTFECDRHPKAPRQTFINDDEHMLTHHILCIFMEWVFFHTIFSRWQQTYYVPETIML